MGTGYPTKEHACVLLAVKPHCEEETNLTRLGTPESITGGSKPGTSDKINILQTKSYYSERNFFYTQK